MSATGEKKRDFWDKLASVSTLVSAIVVALVGAAFTFVYNNRQLDVQDQQARQQQRLREFELLDKFLPYLTSEDDARRQFAYQIFSGLGYEELVTKIGAGDPASEQVLQALVRSPDQRVQELAKRALIQLQEEQRIKAITDFFESGTARPDYGQVVKLGGGLTYGRYGTPLVQPLQELLTLYVAEPAARLAPQLLPYVERTGADTGGSLVDDAEFMRLLAEAGNDLAMQKLQDALFDRAFFLPSLNEARNLGVRSPLGIAAIYDTRVHGGFPQAKDAATAMVGGTPTTGIDEKVWIRAFLEARRDRLKRAFAQMPQVARRAEALLELVEQENWDLAPPIVLLGKVVESPP